MSEAHGVDARGVGPRWLILPLAVFVLVGAPLVLYVWETVSELLGGHFDARSLAIALALGAIFLSAASFLGRHLHQIGSPHPRPTEETDDGTTAR
jgi:hypothetical protein